jgi:hypothetical protein
MAAPPDPMRVIKVYQKLETVFSDGRFAPGWSDERIGNELGGLSKDFVAKIRIEAFGPIKGDPEIEALKSDVDAAKALLRQIEDRIAQAERRRAA